MRKLLVGILVGMALCSAPVFALRIARPAEFHEWNTNTFTQLNDTLLQLWNLSNGRYQLDRVIVDPDGSRACSTGEQVLFDTGTDQICVCITPSTKAWSCVNIT